MTTETAPNRRLIQWFIGTAIFTFTVLLHVTFPNMGGSGLRLPFNAAVWMGFGLMMALAMWPATRGVIRYSAFHKGLGLLLLALWLPFLWTWNEASLIALPRMLTVTAGAILLLGLAQLQLTRRDWWWLGMAILLGALMETALGYVQLYLLEPGNWLGYNPEIGRPYGIFQQVNVMASFLVTGLVVSAWLFGEARDIKLERGVILLAPLFMPALVVVIASRTGWLAALVAMPLVLIHLWNLDRSRFRAWAGTLGVGCLLAVMVSVTQGEEGRSAESIYSQGYRPQVYEHSLRMIAEKPITGWGYGRFQHDFLHSHAEWRTAEEGRATLKEHYEHPHNEILYWGIEGGILPPLAILGFGLWLICWLWVYGPRKQRLLPLSLLTPLSVHALLEYPFYHSTAHFLASLLLLGSCAASRFKEEEKKHKRNFTIKFGVFAAAPVLITFMATHTYTLLQVADFFTKKDASKPYSSLINPLGISNEMLRTINMQNLITSTKNKNKEMQESSISFLTETLRTKPDPVIYRLLRNKELKYEKKEEIEKTGNRLFPEF